MDTYGEQIKTITAHCTGCDTIPGTEYFLHIEIVDVHKGTKWDDTCISDIWTESEEKKINKIPENEVIQDVYEVIEERKIFVKTDKRDKIVLADGKKIEESKNPGEGEYLSITLMDVSPDKEWAQVDYLYSAEGSRVEEYSRLYSVRYLTPIDEKILKTIYGMYGFVEKTGKIYIDTADGLFDLEYILKKFLDSRK